MSRKVVKYHKPYLMQVYGYLILIPFYFGYLGLRNKYTTTDIIFFTLGFLFVLILLLVNHIEPVVRVTEHKVLLYNIFHNKPTKLLIKDFESFSIKNKGTVNVIFNSSKFEIKLNNRDMKKFIKFLEEIS